MPWPTVSVVRRWRLGSSAGTHRCPSWHGRRRASSRGGRSMPGAPIAGWFAISAPGCCSPGLGCGRRWRPTPDPDGARSMRTLVRHRAQLSGPTVTVAVLAAVSSALSGLLGGSVDSLGAEVPMAKPGVPPANNHFANFTVGLYPGLGTMLESSGSRPIWPMAAVASSIRLPASADRAFAAVPAPLLRWGVSLFDPDARPAQVAGNTVVSSVYRGAADLQLRGCPGGADGRLSAAVAADGPDPRRARNRRYRRYQRSRGTVGRARHRRISAITGRCLVADDLGLHL